METLQISYIPSLDQKIGCKARSIRYTGIAIVFVESKHVLPNKILDDSDFAGLNSAVAPDGKKETNTIILHFYKSNTKIRQEKQLGFYHKVDPTML